MTKHGFALGLAAFCLAGCADDAAPGEELAQEDAALTGHPCERGRLEIGCLVGAEWTKIPIDTTEHGPARNSAFPSEAEGVRRAKEVDTLAGKVILYVEGASLRAYLQMESEIVRLARIGKSSDLDRILVESVDLALPAIQILNPVDGEDTATYYAIPREGAVFTIQAPLASINAEADLDGDGKFELIWFGERGEGLDVKRLVPGAGFVAAEIRGTLQEVTGVQGAAMIERHPRFGAVISYEHHDEHGVRTAHLFKMVGDKFELVQKPRAQAQ